MSSRATPGLYECAALLCLACGRQGDSGAGASTVGSAPRELRAAPLPAPLAVPPLLPVRSAARSAATSVTVAPPSPPVPVAPPSTVHEPRPSRLVVLAGGDVSLGRGIGKRLISDIEYDPFRGVAGWISDADIAFVNLECPLADRNGETERPGERNVFTGPPVGAGILARSGIDVVSVANNHAWDYGRSGFLETLDYLTSAGVAYAGGNAQPGEQYQPTILRAKGYRVAVFAVTDVWNPAPFEKHEGSAYVARADLTKLESEMARARKENDVVLVSYHGGREYQSEPTVDTIAFARMVLRHGADAFIGHHPHVAQGIGWVKGKPAFFSLGNLVFGVVKDQPGTGWGFLTKLTFEGGTLSSVRLCPIHITARSLPEEATGVERTARMQELVSMSARVGGTVVGSLDEDGCFGVGPPVAGPK